MVIPQKNQDKLFSLTYDKAKLNWIKEIGFTTRIENFYRMVQHIYCHCNQRHLVINKSCQKMTKLLSLLLSQNSF